MIVTVSRQNYQLIFVFKTESYEGGSLLPIQSNKGRYGFNKIEEVGMNIYVIKIGIQINQSKLIPDETG